MKHSRQPRSAASTSSTISNITDLSQRKARLAIGRAIKAVFEPLEERRMLTAGGLDTTFGSGGKVLTDFNAANGPDDGFAIAALPDGGAVVAGSSASQVALARYDSSGGLVWTNRVAISGLSVANAMVLQGDKFVLAGFSVGVGTNNDFTVARFNNDGSLDTTFGPTHAGYVTTDINGGADDKATSVAIDSSGRILVAGGSGADATRDFAVARYSSDGVLDTSFGSSGIVTTNFGGADQANGVVVDGTMIVAAGKSNGDFALARYSETGALDGTFGSGGKVTVDFGLSSDEGRAIARFGGKYYVVGSAHGDFAVAAFTSTGSLDGGFGSGGKVTVDFDAHADVANAVVVQENGRIVMAGSTVGAGSTQLDFAICRLRPDGTADSTFDGDGKATIDFSGTSNDVANGVALTSGKKIYVGGLSGNSPDDFAIARLQGNTAPILTSVDVSMTNINEDETDNMGDSVASIIGQLTATGSLSDSDGDTGRIAIGDVDDADNGIFEYSTDDGLTWSPLSNVSFTSARLLSSAAGNRIRFVPVANKNSGELLPRLRLGTVAYKGWDGSSGVDGSLADTTVSDGTNSFSSGIATSSIIVEPVNDAPSFTAGPDQTAVVGSPQHSYEGWATSISAGPSDEGSQTLEFVVSVDDPNGVLDAASPPTIDPHTGTLTFKTGSGQYTGQATVIIYLRDSGGHDLGGVDVSSVHTLTITAVDQPGNVVVNDDWTPVVDEGAPGLSFGDTVADSQGLSHTYGIDAYSTIQEGVDFVHAGGVVIVLDGLYTEEVSVDKAMTIEGESQAGVIVQANSGGPVDGKIAFVIDVPANHFHIKRMTIRNSDWGVYAEAGEISIEHCTFYHNGFDGTPFPAPLDAASAAAHYHDHATDGGAIWVVDTMPPVVDFNDIHDNDQGIVLRGYASNQVHHNTISRNVRGGISLFDGSNGSIHDNIITDNMGPGVVADTESGDNFSDNTVSGNDGPAFVLFNPKEIGLDRSVAWNNNQRSFFGDGSTNQWPAAVYARGYSAGHFILHMDGNQLTDNGFDDNPTESLGIYLDSSLGTDGVAISGGSVTGSSVGISSSADHVSIVGVTILHNTVGMLIAGGDDVSIRDDDCDGTASDAPNGTDLRVTGGTISSLTNNHFGATGTYIDLQTSQDLDATSDYFAGYTGLTMDKAGDYEVEDRINHATDDPFGIAGLVRVTAGNVYVTQSSGSIQRGIDAASSGDTVNVDAGTFTEQLSIVGKSLTIIAGGDLTVLQAPVVLATKWSTNAGSIQNRPILFVSDSSNSRIAYMKIDGLGHGNGNVRFEGIAFSNAGGMVDHVTVTNITDTPLSGQQHGVAIYASNTDGVARSLEVSACTITVYQKVGIAVNGANIAALINGNTVIGEGAIGNNAQNGIQIGFGARGNIQNNIVSGNDFTGTTDSAAGILIYGGADGSVVSGNTLSGNDVGVYVTGGTQGLTTITGNEATGSDYDGIFVEGDAVISGNHLHHNGGAGGGGAGGVLRFVANDIHHNGAAGLELYDDITGSEITNNFINDNHGGGIYIDDDADGAASLTVRHNSIRANSDVGLDNRSSESVDARRNWWGSSNGPTNPQNYYNQGAQGDAIIGDATFAPWLASGQDTEPAVAGFQPSSALFAPISNDAGDSFSTIQDAIDGTSPGGTITLADGVYHESNIHVNKPITIQGQSQSGVILNPSMIDSHDDSAFGGTVSNAFVIESSDVSLLKIWVDGNGDGTVGQNFRSAVITGPAALASCDNLQLDQMKFSNLYRQGVSLGSCGGHSGHVGDYITNSSFDHIGTDASLENGAAISLEDTGATISNNVIVESPTGIRAQGPTPLGGSLRIQNNVIGTPGVISPATIARRGIDLSHPGDGTLIAGNQVYMLGAGRDRGFYIVDVADGASLTVIGNYLDMDDDDDGIVLARSGDAAHPVGILNNTIGGSDSADGIVVTNEDFNGVGDAGGTFATILDNEISGFARGVVVTAIDGYGDAHARIGDVGHGNTIDGPGFGVFISGGSRARVVDNTIDCNDTGFNGVQVQDGGLGEITGNQIFSCASGVHIDEGGTASVDFNTFHGNGTDLSLTNNIAGISSVTHNDFYANPIPESQYIENFSPFNIDATTNRWNGSDFEGLTLQQKFAVEDKIFDALDFSGVGYAKLQSGFIYATANSGGVQRGIGVAGGGEILEVQNGTYAGNLVVDVPLTIRGESEAGVILLPSFVGADTGGGSLSAGASHVVLVQASDVCITELTVDGDNPFLHSGIDRNGADIDARNGIITDHSLGLIFDGLVVDHVTVKNIYLRGIYASSGGTFNIHDNTVDNVAGEANSIAIFNFFGSGMIAHNTVTRANDAIAANWSSGTLFLDNVVSQSGSGVHTDNSGGAGGGGDVLRGNIVTDGTAGSYGVWAFAPYSDVLIEQNQVSGVDVGYAAAGSGGIVGSDVLIIFDQNGYDGLHRPNTTGLYVTTDLFGFGDENVHAIVRNDNTFANADTGVFMEQKLHSTLMAIIGNIRSIHGNHIGIDVTGGAATITDNRLYDNDIAIRVSGGGSADIDGNSFVAIPEAGGFQGPANRIDLVVEDDAGLISPMHGNHFGADDWFIQNFSSQDIDATGNTFDAPDNFRIEDKILHAMDDTVAPSLGLGLVTWVAGNLYVTDAGTDHTIQHAIDIASSGEIVNVEAGTYLENLIINKSLTIRGANAGIAADSSARGNESSIDPGSGVVFTIGDNAASVTIDGVEAIGDTGVSSSAVVASPILKEIQFLRSKITATGDGIAIVDGVAIPRFITITASAITAGGTGVTVDGARGVAIPKFLDITATAMRTGHSAVVFSSSSRATISGNTIVCDGADCLVGHGVHGDITIADNTISGAGGNRISIADVDDADNIAITGNDISSTAPGATGIDISGLRPPNSSTKSRSNISNNRVSVSGNGVTISDVDDADIDISGNEITSTATGAIGISVSLQRSSAPATKSSSNIQNNFVHSPAGGIVVSDVYADFDISDNEITCTGPACTGIDVSNQRGATKTRSNIQNNRITASGSGVVMSDIDGDIDIIDNDITSTEAGATGIDISDQHSAPATKSSSNIQNNFVRAPGNGISFVDIDADFEVSRNTITAGDTGVRVENVDGNVDFGGPLDSDGDRINAVSYGILTLSLGGSFSARHEHLADFSNWGLQVTDFGDDLDVSDNVVTSSTTGSGGIYVSNLSSAKITKSRSNIQNNRVTTDTTGVWIEKLQDDLEMSGNEITVDNGTGVLLLNYAAGGDTVIYNNIIYCARSGIVDLDRDGRLDIVANTITGGFEASILVTGMSGGDLAIDGNHVTNTDPAGFAIRAVDVFGNVGMDSNFITSAGDGVSLDGITGHVVLIGHDFEAVGIAFDARHIFGGVTAKSNTFGHGGGGGGGAGGGGAGGLAGIWIVDTTGPTVIGGSAPGEGNSFDGVTIGINIDNAPDVVIANNTMIEVVLAIAVGMITPSTSVGISGNTITGVTGPGGPIGDGISVSGQGTVEITGNTVTHVENAFVVSSLGGPLQVSFEDNSAGYTVKGYTVNARSDTPIGCDFVHGNSVHDAVDGLVLAGEDLSIVGNTLGDMAMSFIDSMFVRLDDHALLGLRIDATHATFDGQLASDYPLAGNFILEDKITHATDDASLGFIRVYDGKVFVTQDSGSIQRGIDAAESGDTLHVTAGSFAENLVVDKSLTISGANHGIPGTSSARGPATLVNPASGSAFVIGDDAGVVTLDGLDQDCDDDCVSILAGVAIPKFITITNSVIDSDDDGVSVEAATAGVAIPKFIDITKTAVRAGGRSVRVSADVSVRITDNELSFGTYGVQGEDVTGDVTILGNTFLPGSGGGGGGGVGVSLTGVIGDVTIGRPGQGNSFTGLERGIVLDDCDDGNDDITDNLISDMSVISISVSNCGASAPVLLARNTITNGGLIGIEIQNVAFADVIDSALNFVDDGIAIYHSGTAAHPVTLGGNSVSNATRGFVVDGVGPTVLIMEPGNSVHDSAVGLVLNGPNVTMPALSLADLDLDGISDKFIVLSNGALAGARIDAVQTQLNGKISSDRSIPENFDIEDKITHATDSASLGFVQVYPGKVFVTQDSGSIQRGVNVVEEGETIHVSAGTFSEAVVMHKWFGVKGEGPVTRVMNPGGNAITIAASGLDAAHPLFVQDLAVVGSVNGIYFDSAVDYVTLDHVVASNNSNAGIEVHNSAVVRHLLIPACTLSVNNVGFRVATTGRVDGMTMSDCTITGNTYGIYTNASSGLTNNQLGFTNIDISDSEISNNTSKGLYFEKLDHADLNGLTVTHNGTAGAFSAGIDINLKYGIYSVMKLQQIIANANGLGDLSNGVGITIKARNDAPSYAGNPASLSGVSVEHVSITGSPTDLAVGNNVLSIDLSDLDFGGTGVGALFYSGPRQTTDLSSSRFAGSLQAYVINAQPGIIDVRTCTFDGVDATTASPQQQFAIVDKILDGVDVGGFGLVRTKTDNVYVTTNSFYAPLGTTQARLQRGVDIAHVGDTVNVNGGSYDGGVVVDQSLAFVGYAIVTVSNDDANVNMVNFVVNSIQVSIDNFAFVGNAAATTSVGIMLGNGAHHASILNSSFSGHTTAIATSPTGVHHTFVWNSEFDLGPGAQGIVLRNTHDDVLLDNTFTGGSTAVVVAGSNNISASNTFFTDGGTAIDLEDCDDVDFTNNRIVGATDVAIVVSGCDHVSIRSNDINVDTGKTWTRIRAGLAGNAGGATDVRNNSFSGAPDIGVVVEAGFAGTLSMHTNSFTGSAVAALDNESTALVDATGNWWNSPNGPDSPFNTWGGMPKGERIIGPGPVIFAPWLTDGVDADPAARGFQHAPPSDTTGPAVSPPDLTAASDSGASDHDEITSDDTPTFTGTAEPGATVHLVEGSTDLGSTFADAAGEWTITSRELTPGSHYVEVFGIDEFGNSGFASSGLTVYIDTANPIAIAGDDQTVNEGDEVTLAASESDPGGFGPYSFRWTQVSGPSVFTSRDGQVVKFTPDVSGSYVFEVTATDAAGNVGSDSISIQVDNVNPVVTAVDLDHTSILENGDVHVTGSFSDASTADTHTVSIAWGDGTSSLATVDQASRTYTATHRYRDDNPSGTSSDQYTISVTATDSDLGTSGPVARLITVNNVAPTCTIVSAPPTSPEGAIIVVTSSCQDLSPDDIFTYAWSVTKNGHPFATGSDSGFTFTPDDDGTYVLTLTGTDDDTGADTDVQTITVTDVAPTIALSGNTHVNEAATYTLTLGAVTDPGTDTVTNYYVNWGDSSLDVYTTAGPKTHTYADGPASRSIVVSLEDENGIHPNAGSFSVTVDNVSPTATFGNLGSVDEGSSGFVIFTSPSDPSGGDTTAGFKYSYDFNNDGTFDQGNGTYGGGVFASSATVTASFLADGPGTRTVRGRISDRDGGFTDYFTTITINNVAPIVSAGPDANSGVGAFFTQSGSFTDPGTDSPWSVYVNYDYNAATNNGLGILSQSGSLKNFVLSHFYNTAGTYDVRVTVFDKDGAGGVDDIIVTVANTRFQVMTLTPTASGFDVRMNRAANATLLNLYDGLDPALDPADVTLTGTTTGAVRGSLVWNPQTNVAHFVKSGGPLLPDTYTIALASRADGWTDNGGELLDGDYDNVAGGDYGATFTVSPSSARAVSMQDYARGPGQPVNIPATGNGIPIRIDDAAGVNAVDLDVTYDGFILNVTGATLAPGMPSDWSITTNLITNGIFKITISGITTLPAGPRDLITLNASVLPTAPYGNSEVITLQNLSVNGGFIASRADSAVHKNTYLGDASGNGALSAFDASLISRVVVALDSGFDNERMTDPVIVADVNGNGVIDGLDASWVAQKGLAPASRPEIPNVPPGTVTNFATVDPTFAMPTHVPASPGGSVTVPLSVTDSAEGLIGFDVFVNYDTSRLDVASGLSSPDVAMGSFFASAGWSWVTYVDDTIGQVGMSFYRTTFSGPGTGAIANITFHVPLSATSGDTTLDVNGVPTSEVGGLSYTYVDGSIAIDASAPIITGTSGDDSYYVRHGASDNNIEVYSGTSASGTLIYSAPLASLSTLTFDTGAGNDRVIVDQRVGSALPSGGITYNAGADNDALTLIGDNSGSASYQPSSTPGSGYITAGGSNIAFSGVEPVTASGFATLAIVTPNANDVISIEAPAVGQNRITGTSGGTAFSPLTFFDVANPILDTASNDGGAGPDSITISSAGLGASGLAVFAVDAGTGANTLTVNGGTVPLNAINGANLAVTANNSSLLNLATTQTLQSLAMNDTAQVTLAAGHNVLQLGSILLATGSKLDITDGTLRVSDTGAFSTIRSYVRNGRNGGLWNGNGITSTIVAGDSGRLAVASVISGSDVVVKPAVIGDLNLDGTVSIFDFISLSSHFNTAGVWDTGDLNYDDFTTISDFIALAAHFNQSYASSAAPAFATAAQPVTADPEPAAAAEETATRQVLVTSDATTVSTLTTTTTTTTTTKKTPKKVAPHHRAAHHRRASQPRATLLSHQSR